MYISCTTIIDIIDDGLACLKFNKKKALTDGGRVTEVIEICE